MYHILRILALCSIAAHCIASEQAVLAVLRPVAEAAVRGDLTVGIDIMYEPVVVDLGGKKKLLEAVTVAKDQMAAQKIKIVRFDIVRPFRFIQGAKRHYVIVPTLTEIDMPEGRVRSHGFQFGVEVKSGVWQFLDGAQTTSAVVAKYFPDFPSAEKLPEGRQEMIDKKD